MFKIVEHSPSKFVTINGVTSRGTMLDIVSNVDKIAEFVQGFYTPQYYKSSLIHGGAILSSGCRSIICEFQEADISIMLDAACSKEIIEEMELFLDDVE